MFSSICVLMFTSFLLFFLYLYTASCCEDYVQVYVLYICTSFLMRGNTLYVLQKVQVGKDQEKAQSEKDSHSKNQGGKKPN